MVFHHEDDARQVLDVLPKRFAKSGLTLHPEKTRLVLIHRPLDYPTTPICTEGHLTCFVPDFSIRRKSEVQQTQQNDAPPCLASLTVNTEKEMSFIGVQFTISHSPRMRKNRFNASNDSLDRDWIEVPEVDHLSNFDIQVNDRHTATRMPLGRFLGRQHGRCQEAYAGSQNNPHIQTAQIYPKIAKRSVGAWSRRPGGYDNFSATWSADHVTVDSELVPYRPVDGHCLARFGRRIDFVRGTERLVLISRFPG
jgi:hypothetical protein